MIIGSTAIKHWYPDFNREPKDVDIINNCFIDEYMDYEKRVEFLNNDVLKDWMGTDCKYCTPNELYTLKMSHIFWDLENNSWDKHMYDIQFLKGKGCKVVPELFNLLYMYWNKVHGVNRRSNLDMTSENFFNNVVSFPVEHDYIHELLIKHPYFNGQSQPMYTKILKDGADVDVSEEKFNLLSYKEKFNLVVEEVMVMALERHKNMYYKKAFGRMLKKFIISHAPIWEAIWIIENHKYIMQNIPFDFINFLNLKIVENENNSN